MANPVFLGIGAQKAGTTWLDACLRRHPDFWLPPVKELHYFDRAPQYPSSTLLYPDGRWRRLVGPRRARIARQTRRAVRAHYRSPRLLRWYLRYYLGHVDDRWYRSLFDDGNGLISGEITPDYSVLSDADVRQVHHAVPDAQLVLLLRNPSSRAWSRYRHLVGWKRKPAQPTLDDFTAWVESPEQAPYSDYSTTIERWRTRFPEEQMLIAFYDEVIEAPADLLERVVRFLGGRHDRTTISTILTEDRVNESPSLPLPEAFREYLDARYARELDRLEALIGPVPEAWKSRGPAALEAM